MSHRRSLFVAMGSLVAILVVALARWAVIQWDNPQITNYAVACIPMVLTILIAFVPDLRRAHVGWRIAVVGIGVAWSVLLWRQQVLADKAQAQALAKVVKDTNEHADQQLKNRLEPLTNEVNGVDGRVNKLADQLTGRDTAFTTALGKIAPLGHAKLQFSAWVEDQRQYPLLRQYAALGDNGSVDIDFTVKNISQDTSTGRGDIWMLICTGCTYPKDPTGFSKRQGADEHQRHKTFDFINAGILLEKMTASVVPPIGVGSFQLSFKYSCETCGRIDDWQTLLIFTRAMPALKLTPPRLTSQ